MRDCVDRITNIVYNLVNRMLRKGSPVRLITGQSRQTTAFLIDSAEITKLARQSTQKEKMALRKKYCFRCGLTKDESEFYPNRSRQDRLSDECKECNGRLRRSYYRRNRSAIAARTADYYQRNRAEINHQRRAKYAAKQAQRQGNSALEQAEASNAVP